MNKSLKKSDFMEKISKKKFEKIVAEGIKSIPEKFLNRLKNVVIVIEDKPNSNQKKELNIRSDWALFGLYEGIPQIERGAGYAGVIPDKITIFQESIEMAARNEEDMREIVKNTVWHEIAHHFGMNENEVYELEKRRVNNLKK